MREKEIGYNILKSYKKGVKSIVKKDNLVIVNIEKEEILPFLNYLKKHSGLRCESLLDIWGVDYPNKRERFEVNYMLLSVRYNIRIIVKLRVDEYSEVESVTGIFKSGGWLEREVWDMYGVYFTNHHDMRRILTDYGFGGHPLRKDYPLSGYTEVRYDDGEKRVVIEPLEVAQEYRYFSFKSPWEKKR